VNERALRSFLLAAASLYSFACDLDVVVGHAPSSGVIDDGGEPIDNGTPLIGPRSQLRWLSGSNTGNNVERFLDFEAWRARPSDLALSFVDRWTGWPGLVNLAWPVDTLEAVEGRLLLAIPLYPEGEGNNQDCAAGAYDAQWRMLGPFLRSRGRGDSIIRLGWGLNDSAHMWRADQDPTDWVECFRRVANALRQTGPELEIAWDFNRQGRADTSPLDPYSGYPGDEYVDYIGIEGYDMAPPARTEAEWDEICNGPTGLCSVMAFARAHGKRLGLSEWSVVSCQDNGGGDNPFYVDKMFELFSKNPSVMGFEAYYEDAALCSAIFESDDNPNAAARYRELYARE